MAAIKNELSTFETITRQMNEVDAQGERIIAAAQVDETDVQTPFGTELFRDNELGAAYLGGLACVRGLETRVDDDTSYHIEDMIGLNQRATFSEHEIKSLM